MLHAALGLMGMVEMPFPHSGQMPLMLAVSGVLEWQGGCHGGIVTERSFHDGFYSSMWRILGMDSCRDILASPATTGGGFMRGRLLRAWLNGTKTLRRL
jgi:hypothetical protein